MEIKTEESSLTKISYERGELHFQDIEFKGAYGKVAGEIDKAGLKRPNSAETASLVDYSWKNPEEKYSQEIISILENNWFWEFTGNLYLPKSHEEINNGVILENNPKIINGKLAMDKNSLVQRLQNNDPLVKFVPFGYKIGKQNLIELQKNPYVLARYGKEGTEKMAEVASKYKNKPYIWSFDSVDKEETTLSVLSSGWYFGDRLYVDGGFLDNRKVGHAFGIK